MRSVTDQTMSDLLARADRATEWIAGVVRLVVGIVLLAGLEWLSTRASERFAGLEPLVFNASIVIGIVAASGLLSLVLIRLDAWRPWMAYLTVTIDAAMVSLLLHFSFQVSGLSTTFAFAFPSVTVIPLFFAVTVLRFRPAVQFYASVLFVIGPLLAMATVGAPTVAVERPHAMIDALFGSPLNIVRFAMFMLTAGVLVLAAARGRRMLLRAVQETTNRLNLSRFVPTELAPLMATGVAGAPQSGRKANVALMFVDMRDSTTIEENAEPEELVAIISEYRALILEAAGAHGGVVDKFVGDGAFVVFGVPESRGDDAARAISCARAILASIGGWNETRRAAGGAPIRVGIGVHAGEAFVGIVGATSRLEFAVLGDSVNVASRVERETKALGVPLLVSASALALAGEDPAGWRCLGKRPLRGRSEPVELFAADAVSAKA